MQNRKRKTSPTAAHHIQTRFGAAPTQQCTSLLLDGHVQQLCQAGTKGLTFSHQKAVRSISCFAGLACRRCSGSQENLRWHQTHCWGNQRWGFDCGVSLQAGLQNYELQSGCKALPHVPASSNVITDQKTSGCKAAPQAYTLFPSLRPHTTVLRDWSNT